LSNKRKDLLSDNKGVEVSIRLSFQTINKGKGDLREKSPQLITLVFVPLVKNIRKLDASLLGFGS